MKLTETDKSIIVEPLKIFREKIKDSLNRLSDDTQELVTILDIAKEEGLDLNDIDEDIKEATKVSKNSFDLMLKDLAKVDKALAILGEK